MTFRSLQGLVLLGWLIPGVVSHGVSGQALPTNPSDPGLVQTAAERTDYRETTRYGEVIRIVETLAAASPQLHLTGMGYTYEGRSLPLVIVSTETDPTPESLKTSGKVRVYLQANIHAGEVCGKEALLILLRDLAQNRHRPWLDSLVLLIAPIYNADGNERVRLDNRPRQHGPVAGMGQRPNAQGYDLNRDHMKLDAPESRSMVRMLNTYDPHVLVDLHTTNGTRHAYHLTYAPPLHPNTPPALDQWVRSAWLPALTDSIFATYGWRYYYYGNTPYPGMDVERGWYTFDHRPRFGTNYAGLRNRFGILSEAYSYATFEERIQATARFVEELLDFAHGHASTIRRLTAEADTATLAGQQLALTARFGRSEAPVEILLGETVEERNPYSGALMLRRTDTVRPEPMVEYGTFVPVAEETVPAAYLVPDSLTRVVDRLEAHGIRIHRLTGPVTASVERFRLDSVTVAERAFQGHHELRLAGVYEEIESELTEDHLVVLTSQPLGRLAFSLLEPQSDDGLASWNLVGEALTGAEYYPVLRMHDPVRSASMTMEVVH